MGKEIGTQGNGNWHKKGAWQMQYDVLTSKWKWKTNKTGSETTMHNFMQIKSENKI